MTAFLAHSYHEGAPSGGNVSITVSEGASLLVIVLHTNNSTTNVNSATFGGSAMTISGSNASGNQSRAHILIVQNPNSGAQTFAPTFSATLTVGYTAEVFQFSGAMGVSNLSVQSFGVINASTSTKQVTFTGLANRFAVVSGCSYDDNTSNASAGVPDVDFTAGYTVNSSYRQIVSGYVSALASASETFDLQFNDSIIGGGTINSFVTVGFTVDDAVPSITNVDSDDSISQGQQDIVINVANIPTGNVPIRAGAHGTAGVGGTDFTGLVVTPGVAGAFTITCDVPVGIALSTSTECYVEHAPE